jgi:hypothetical protein
VENDLITGVNEGENDMLQGSLLNKKLAPGPKANQISDTLKQIFFLTLKGIEG